MKNLFSKSTSEFDFQKFFNLILTEQRAQRVDLARLHNLITKLDGKKNDFTILEDEEEQPDDISGSTR